MKQIEITSDYQLKAMLELEYKQSHDLTEAKMPTNPAQYDLLSMILANYKEGNTLYRIYLKDIEYITGRQWNYEQLKQATQKMGSHMFDIELPDRKRQLWLLSSVEYFEGKGFLEIDLNPKALPIIENIKESGYTSIQLKSTITMTSMYAKRIYGLCCKWASINYKEYSLEEIKRILNLINLQTGEENYKKVYDLKIKVLEVAKRQINEHTNIKFDYELIKKHRSRSFNYVAFYIDKQKAQQSVINFDFTSEQQIFIKDLIVYGFSEYQAELIVPIVSRDQWQIMIDDLNVQIKFKKTTVDKAIPFLCGVLTKKYKIEGLITKNN